MKNCQKEISEEIYKRAMANHGCLRGSDYQKVFSTSELMGYGVYNDRVAQEGNKYFVKYQTGDSCD